MFAHQNKSESGLASFTRITRARAWALAILAIVAFAPPAMAGAVVLQGAVAVDASTGASGDFNLVAPNPIIEEDVIGEWTAGSTITITAPLNFSFDASQLVTAGVVSLPDATFMLASTTATPTASTITFTITVASTTVATQLQFSNIRVRANACSPTVNPGDTAQITVDSSASPINGNPLASITVTAANGPLHHFTLSALPTTAQKGTPITITVTGFDQCDNPIPAFDFGGGAGQIVLTATAIPINVRTFADGAVPGNFTITDPDTMDNTANVNFPGNAFDANGRGTFNVTSNTGEGPVTIEAASGAAMGTVGVTWIDAACTLAPLTDTNQIGATHLVTLSVTRNGAAVGAGIPVTFQITAGPNSGAATPAMTDGAGQATFSYPGTGGTGTDTIKAIATVDGVMTMCTATKTWIDIDCALAPLTDVNQINTPHTVTLTLQKNGLAVAAHPVTFQVTVGPNIGFPSIIMTDGAGQAMFTYMGGATPGIDTITASGIVDTVPFACTATKEFINASCTLTPPTSINATGANHLVTATINRNGAAVGAGVVVNFVVVGGPNAGTAGASATNGAGQATFMYAGIGGPGTDTIQASAQVDGVPTTCTATKEWINPSCSLAPLTQSLLITPAADMATVTATILRSTGMPVPIGTMVTFLITAGPNAGTTDTVPTTDAAGHAAFTYLGSDVVGSDDIQASGMIDGVAFLCTAPGAVTWIDTGCMLTPMAGIHQVDSTQAVTAMVIKNGVPVVGTLMSFQVTAGPNIGQAAAVLTNAGGKAVFSYTSNGVPGTDTITSNGTIDGLPINCAATKEWITVGCAMTPPAGVNQVGGLHMVSVQLSRNPALPGAIGPGVTVNFEVVGVNGPITDSAPTNAAGLATFSYMSNGTVGSDTITATGVISGVPFTCSATKEWINAQCELTPATSSGAVATQHSLTMQVSKNGLPVGAGVPVTFQITAGPNAGAVVPSVTNVSGQATFMYTGNATPGQDTITGHSTVQGVVTTCIATRDWVSAGCTLSPPTDTNPVGTNHTVTVTVSRNGVPAPANVMVHFEIIGGLSPNAGKSANVPTVVGGTAMFTYLGNGGVGEDTIEASGVVDGAPFTCTATKKWITTGCALDPPTDTNQIGSNHTVTVTVMKNGAAASGIPVNFLVIGAGSPNSGTNGMGVTDAMGHAAFTYPGSGGVGTDTIQASGTVDGVPFTCTATKTWIDATCNLAPATDTNQVGGNHMVMVTVTSNGVAQMGVLTSFDVISGPNTGQSGVFFTNAIGKASFAYVSNGTAGIDTIRASGLVSGVPFECTATKEWISAGCSLAPLADTNQISTNHSVTITVTKNGAPQAGVTVNFAVTAGPNAGQVGVRITNGPGPDLGKATFTYPGGPNPGTDTIEATGSIAGVPFTCTATKTWINAGCSLSPPTDTNVVNTQHTVTVTVNSNGAPVPGINVVFNVTAGPNSGKNGNGVTNALGQAGFAYTGVPTAGTDTIQASGNVNGVPFNCTALKTWILDDQDGVPPDVEDMGPNNGDGNNDGIPDSLQSNVTTFKDIFGHFVTIESPAGTTLVNVMALDVPSPEIAPPGLIFPYGFFKFEVHGVAQGGSADVRIFLHGGPTINTYYKFGPTPILPVDHYYRFLFDGTTGAEVNADIITLHLVDGMRGDSDLTANGVIVEPGGPALEADNPAPLIAAPACGACGNGAAPLMPMMMVVAGLLHVATRRRR